MSSHILKVAKRGDSVVQAHLPEHFTNVLHDPLIRENVARDSPEMLYGVFASARRSEVLLTKLGRRSVDSNQGLKVCYECGRRGHVRERCPDLNEDWEREATNHEV